MPLDRTETESALREMCRDFTGYVREYMVQHGKALTTIAVVTTPDSMAVLTILDVSQHLAVFREAVTTIGATGLVFVHDGWTTIGDQERVDALLIVWASQWGTAEGFAHRYELTPFGIRFGDTLVATPEHLAPYVEVFRTVGE